MHGDDCGRAQRYPRGQIGDIGIQRAVIQRAIDQAVTLCLLGAKIPRAEQKFHAARRPRRHHRAGRAAASCQKATRSLGEAEQRPPRGKAHIECECELQPTTPTTSVDLGDLHLRQRLPGKAQRLQHVHIRVAARLAGVGFCRDHIVEIKMGDEEVWVGTLDHDHAHLWVLAQATGQLEQLLDHLAAH